MITTIIGTMIMIIPNNDKEIITITIITVVIFMVVIVIISLRKNSQKITKENK